LFFFKLRTNTKFTSTQDRYTNTYTHLRN